LTHLEDDESEEVGDEDGKLDFLPVPRSFPNPEKGMIVPPVENSFEKRQWESVGRCLDGLGL
jgi:hypothetical protein